MDSNQSLGQFEQLVLTAAYLLRGEGYSINIADKVNEIALKRVMIGTVFVSLNRLEKRGLLSSHFAKPMSRRGGKAKRYFRLAPAGFHALAQLRATAAMLLDLLKDLR